LCTAFRFVNCGRMLYNSFFSCRYVWFEIEKLRTLLRVRQLSENGRRVVRVTTDTRVIPMFSSWPEKAFQKMSSPFTKLYYCALYRFNNTAANETILFVRFPRFYFINRVGAPLAKFHAEKYWLVTPSFRFGCKVVSPTSRPPVTDGLNRFTHFRERKRLTFVVLCQHLSASIWHETFSYLSFEISYMKNTNA